MRLSFLLAIRFRRVAIRFGRDKTGDTARCGSAPRPGYATLTGRCPGGSEPEFRAAPGRFAFVVAVHDAHHAENGLLKPLLLLQRDRHAR
jgi:hypothetical protein